MTFTPHEAEQILREQWDDADSVGGFLNRAHHYRVTCELVETYGEDSLTGLTLIGYTYWTDYEEGGEQFLFIRNSDDSLWSISAETSVYGEYGTSFDELSATTIDEWLEDVVSNIEHMETFVGC